MNTSKILSRKALPLAVSLLALSVSGGAFSATATENLAVSATVVDNCTISTTALAFGNYDPIVVNASANLDGTGTVTITCTLNDAVTIMLGEGLHASAPSPTNPARRLSDGATTPNYLSYVLYSDSARSTVWGNDATVAVAATGTGAANAHTVYGAVNSGQNKPFGSYSDTVVATVTF